MDDVILIQPLLLSLKHSADQLHSLHSKYNEYYTKYQSESQTLTPKLSSLVIKIYDTFYTMKQALQRLKKYESELTGIAKIEFNNFQRHCNQFASTQHRLLFVAKQYYQIITQSRESIRHQHNQHIQEEYITSTKRSIKILQCPRLKKEYTMDDIPIMGYAYIGSRMGQLLSQISLSQQELSAAQKRIENSINQILCTTEPLSYCDAVSYGSVSQQLFIKDYSNFNFCVRFASEMIEYYPWDNDIGAIGGINMINYVARLLSNKRKEFDEIKILNSNDHEQSKYIQFLDKKSSCKVNLIFNDIIQLFSSRLIAAFQSIDPKFGLLCKLIKYWAKQRKICDPAYGALSSYSLVLMVINFLQLRRVVPTLSPWSVHVHSPIVQYFRNYAQYDALNEEQHSKLLVHFFYFFACKFDYGMSVVSVRTGTVLTRKEKKWLPNKSASLVISGYIRHEENKLNVVIPTDILMLLLFFYNPQWICIENPFFAKCNLAENVQERHLNYIRKEFMRAFHILCTTYKIYEVCKLCE